MVCAELRPLLEDSSKGEVIADARSDNVRAAVAALFEDQPPSIEWLAQFQPEVVGIIIELRLETAEARAVRILRANGMDARLHHTGGGIWVAEIRSQRIPDRVVWITDSEGDEQGPFLVGVYPSADVEGEAIDSLSGVCSEVGLVAKVRGGLESHSEGEQ